MRKLTGPDADIETSLKEYGLAWQVKGKDIVFYYGVATDQENDYYLFDWGCIPLDTDIKKEFDWADFEAVSNYIGMCIFDCHLIQQIQDLVSYYSTEEIFGTSYGSPMSYCEVVTGRKLKVK